MTDRVRVWDGFVRLFHWSLVALIAGTWLTADGPKLWHERMGYAIAGLDRVDELKPALESLGQRHVGYGVQDSHYATVVAALLWTLEQALKTDYTSETHEAWTAVYTFISETMKGAERHPAEAAAVV